jgi:catechol 2,3-dioxygenase-like lactoylglutathione lyase family enzyme
MPIASLSAVILDCPDPAALAEFYRKVTGWEVASATEEYVYLAGGGEIRLGFQLVAEHPWAGWPADTKQFHLDFAVADVAEAERELLAAGASRPEFQPGGDKWLVLVDPAGHAFCITATT